MYNPLDKTPLQHNAQHYLEKPLAGEAKELFECHWSTRTLAVELAGVIGLRQGHRARVKFWEEHTTPDVQHPWGWRLSVCNALAELGYTVHVVNRHKS